MAAIASSCSKSNDEITNETQTTAVNTANLKTGHLDGQEITHIMMYCPNSYSKNGQPTIKRANNTTFTYNRTGFTTRDINTINAMYP
ncbi:hypothetical protein H5J24_02305 [Chryseobacterium capnotolerans]|uniref:hypothetical protein n=1 Tax=Chryseobacterium TaxID=59732 RepID=UPI000AC18386|nr:MULTISPECIES: hypothetical protein [Chryseobacterium]UHO39018.1 hypothetical protein H5J24_02305 [Chryseobacterium capnotolerans]